MSDMKDKGASQYWTKPGCDGRVGYLRERSDQISKKVFYERPNNEIGTSSSVSFHFYSS